MVARCNAANAAGNPCSGQPLLADGLCYWHSSLTVEERAQARRRGGQNRSNKARAAKALPAGVMTNAELLGLVGITIKAVLSGKLEPGIGNAVASLARAYVTISEAGAVETLQTQVDELRAQMARRGLA